MTKLSRFQKYLLVLAWCLSWYSCKEKEIPIPLSEEKMIEVLIDIHMAEAMLDKLPITDQDTVGHVYYRMIFREHEVSQEDFDRSMAVLREDPVRLNVIYEQILEQLNVLEATERGIDKMEE